MLENNDCSSNASCGCRVETFSTDKECPVCQHRLRLAGRLQLAQFRLACPNCDYQGPLLSQTELQEVL